MTRTIAALGIALFAAGCVCYRRIDTETGVDRRFPPGPLYGLFCE